MGANRQNAGMAHPSLSTVAELLKPITWFPPMWAFACGVVASSQSLGSNVLLILLGLVLTGPLVCASSQAVNDWFDRHVDAINEPHRPIPSGRMPGQWGLYIAILWTLLALSMMVLAHRRVQRSLWLVGAGPGSPHLLTLAAYDALREADVVIADRIASPALKALVPPGAVFLEADKVPGNADCAQEELNAWGVGALRAGKRVVRLKVGDPFLFEIGGNVVMIDETNMGAVAFIDAAAARSTVAT